MSAAFRASMAFLDKLVPRKLQPFWHHPAGPKTIFFWAPAFKWGLVVAGIQDIARPVEKLSLSQCLSLFFTGIIWARYSMVIIPKNYNLFSVNVFIAGTQCYHLTRIANTFLYVKFVLVWSLVLLADFILEFRFEYLWPFWLFLRSVYDSFKYQGLAFSVFFVCIALTSDMICFLFIPVHWLFFAASTYVWVQYVWHTERGVCLPTVSLWLLFVYIEASVRLKELKNLPFHLDLCRPFAAHCIGYPVVTLGFGFKSYIGYKMRQRKQKEVAKENYFYMQLLQQALPNEQQSLTTTIDKNSSSSKSIDDICTDSSLTSHNNSTNNSNSLSNSNSSGKKLSGSHSSNVKNCENAVVNSKLSDVEVRESKRHHHHHHHHHHQQQQHIITNGHASLEKELEYMETHHQSNVNHKVKSNNSVNDFDENEDFEHDKSFKANGVLHKMSGSNGTSGANFRAGSWGSPSNSSSNHVKDNSIYISGSQSSGKKSKNSSAKENAANNLNSQKDDHLFRLESDIKRLKADLQASRQCEQDLRMQINSYVVGERSTKNELMQLQQDNESLQSKLHGLVTARQQDKQTISSLEKKLQEEKRSKSVLESQLVTERKNKKAEETAARAVALATANTRNECSENCKIHRRDLETDVKILRRDLKMCEERLRQSEREAQALRQYKENQNDTEVLMSALSAMQDKNAHLENSLSAETRLKLDLFSALGEAKRQLGITQSLALQKDKEIDDLKSKIAEVMAVMPPTAYTPVSLDSGMMSPSLYSSKFVTEDKITTSNLDPNALVYTPKGVSAVNSADM